MSEHKIFFFKSPFILYFQIMAQGILQDKVLKYENFLNDQLRPDLKTCLEQRDTLYEENAEYLALKNSIEAIKASNLPKGQPLKTKVDLGSNFYAKASVPNPEVLFVDVGLGFFLEMTYDEALDFIGQKTKLLDQKAEVLTKESSKIKANIKIVLHGLREIQGTIFTGFELFSLFSFLIPF